MQTVTSANKLAYSIPEAVAATGIGRSTLYQHIKAGALIVTKIGGRTVIRAEHLTAWLDACAGANRSQPTRARKVGP